MLQEPQITAHGAWLYHSTPTRFWRVRDTGPSSQPQTILDLASPAEGLAAWSITSLELDPEDCHVALTGRSPAGLQAIVRCISTGQVRVEMSLKDWHILKCKCWHAGDVVDRLEGAIDLKWLTSTVLLYCLVDSEQRPCQVLLGQLPSA